MLRPSPFPQNIKRAPTDHNALEYWLFVSRFVDSADNAYDSDATLNTFDRSLDGSAIVFVNDSPVEILAQVGKFFRINEWLTPRKNTIYIEGDYQQELYVKVVTLRSTDFSASDQRFERVVAKMRVSPRPRQGGNKDAPRLVFDADIDYTPFFDVLPVDDRGKKQTEEEARLYLKALMVPLRKHNFNLSLNIAVAPWEDRPRWGELFPNHPRETEKMVDNTKNDLVTQVEDLQIVAGRYGVLVTSGCWRDEVTGGRFYSFVFEDCSSHEKYRLLPIQLARVSGRWEVWNVCYSEAYGAQRKASGLK